MLDNTLYWILSNLNCLSLFWFGLVVVFVVIRWIIAISNKEGFYPVLIGGLSLAGLGLVTLILIMSLASNRLAPPGFFHKLTPAESQYFRHKLLVRNKPFSINRFVLTQDEYRSELRENQDLEHQKAALQEQKEALNNG